MNKISKAFGLFFLLGVLGQVVSSTPSLPNVVIIYVDDMGYGDLGVQNPDSLIPTPIWTNWPVKGCVSRTVIARLPNAVQADMRY